MKIEMNARDPYDAKHHMECVWNCIVGRKDSEVFHLRRLTIRVDKTDDGYTSTEEARTA